MDNVRRRSTFDVGRSMLVLVVAWAVAGSTALATVSNDREYLLGEGLSAGTGLGDVVENGVAGQIVGTGVAPAVQDLHSVDNAGIPNTSGTYHGLEQDGDPIYANVSPGGAFARPGTSAGDTGVQFDGSSEQYLLGIPLNRPDVLVIPPIDYTGITGRGLQLWVYPDATALGSEGTPTTFQSIVSDSAASGGPAISATGQWTQINSGHVGDIPTSVDVAAGDTWYHVMHHNYPQSAPDVDGNIIALSVVYVDGMAVSANLDTITDDNAESLVVGAAQHTVDSVLTIDSYFTGVVDNLEMYVFDGSFGTFSLFTDNEWVAADMAANHPGVSGVPTDGDVDLDGDVDDDDVTAFIAGWRKEKGFGTPHSGTVFAGDYETWGWGDSNLDGQVNFSDWFLLRANHPTGASLDLGALLNGTNVPEPSSVVLLLLGAVGTGLALKRRRAA